MHIALDVRHAASYGNGLTGMLGAMLLITAWEKGVRQKRAGWVRFGGLIALGCPVVWLAVDLVIYYTTYTQSTALPLWTPGLVGNTLVVLLSALVGLWVVLTTFHPDVAADLNHRAHRPPPSR